MFVIMKINILILSSDSKNQTKLKLIGYRMIYSRLDKINYVVFSSFSDPSRPKNFKTKFLKALKLEVIVVEACFFGTLPLVDPRFKVTLHCH